MHPEGHVETKFRVKSTVDKMYFLTSVVVVGKFRDALDAFKRNTIVETEDRFQVCLHHHESEPENKAVLHEVVVYSDTSRPGNFALTVQDIAEENISNPTLKPSDWITS